MKNDCQEEIRIRDAEIVRLNKVNEQLRGWLGIKHYSDKKIIKRRQKTIDHIMGYGRTALMPDGTFCD